MKSRTWQAEQDEEKRDGPGDGDDPLDEVEDLPRDILAATQAGRGDGGKAVDDGAAERCAPQPDAGAQGLFAAGPVLADKDVGVDESGLHPWRRGVPSWSAIDEEKIVRKELTQLHMDTPMYDKIYDLGGVDKVALARATGRSNSGVWNKDNREPLDAVTLELLGRYGRILANAIVPTHHSSAALNALDENVEALAGHTMDGGTHDPAVAAAPANGGREPCPEEMMFL
ncbi:hypothetical protein CMQ_5674 [Grosmannia clavigera kw1407]|uniref:Uncharacterized protein n=1 Tax=Grosmannia clavigera (strain kw1407 / UAMH 11150) TaxID=655863 RepID=F0XSZ3_GROCL|nr:uncharacterized protein CMQ_5674 [Grosmannia clavigera kw1407]EFW99253.1 hypothetical protein CMQ_5674 [Grosmannia clavigera kw1407]